MDGSGERMELWQKLVFLVFVTTLSGAKTKKLKMFK